jgi:hypothetical protein
MASTGLLVPAALGVRLRRRGKPSVSVGICQVAVQGGSPRQLTSVEARSQGSDVVRKQRNTQVLVHLPVTYVPGGTSRKAETLELQHL